MKILPTTCGTSFFCRACVPLLLMILLSAFFTPVFAQLPPGFVQKKLTGDNINEATAMVHAPDGRIFIAERSGNVKVALTKRSLVAPARLYPQPATRTVTMELNSIKLLNTVAILVDNQGRVLRQIKLTQQRQTIDIY